MNIVQRKICLLGDYAVGKTSLVRRYVENRFDDKYISTIGVRVSRKQLALPDGQLNLLIWDLVGGSDFSNRELGYLAGTSGALIVCDLTRLETLEVMRRYTQQLRIVNPAVGIVYVANKSDLAAERAIDEQTLAATCEALRAPYVVTSAKTGEAVEAAFWRLAAMLEAGRS